MLTDQIADLLKTARKGLGLTQKELARRAGVSHRLWAEVERGERPNVSLETALRMLSEVGVGIRLTDPRGTSREIRGPGTEAAARAARAAVRRATWQGRQIRLDQEGQEGQASPAAARAAGRLGAVTRVSEQAFAVARSRAAGTRGSAARPSARSPKASTKPAAKSSTRPSAGARK
jgi:transcriptional regulator with XRE-family HTH domain